MGEERECRDVSWGSGAWLRRAAGSKVGGAECAGALTDDVCGETGGDVQAGPCAAGGRRAAIIRTSARGEHRTFFPCSCLPPLAGAVCFIIGAPVVMLPPLDMWAAPLAHATRQLAKMTCATAVAGGTSEWGQPTASRKAENLSTHTHAGRRSAGERARMHAWLLDVPTKRVPASRKHCQRACAKCTCTGLCGP